MTATPTVRVGSIWADNDRRAAGRKVRVVEVDDTHATVEQVDSRAHDRGKPGHLPGDEPAQRAGRLGRRRGGGHRLHDRDRPPWGGVLMFPDAEWATQHEAVLRDWADALADHRRGDPVTAPAPTPAIATSFEQDARDAAPAEDRLLDALADSITRGVSPLQAARHLFGGSRD